MQAGAGMPRLCPVVGAGERQQRARGRQGCSGRGHKAGKSATGCRDGPAVPCAPERAEGSEGHESRKSAAAEGMKRQGL